MARKMIRYFHKADEIIAYTYEGNIWCVSCINHGVQQVISKQELTPVFLYQLNDEVCDCCQERIEDTI